ncbi:hypothetical protein [Amycolatopsis magusensis]|uniref:hypothetical protein n=1 Tax=Amycolatopsis magusensis TaxID=882444 RepID=UPI003C2B5C30
MTRPDWPYLPLPPHPAEAAAWNVTVVVGTLDHPIDPATAWAVAERMHGSNLLDVLADDTRVGVAAKSELELYPALEQAGEAFVDGLADAGFKLRNWERVEWLSAEVVQPER